MTASITSVSILYAGTLAALVLFTDAGAELALAVIAII
jgi:hypothetical protein